MVNTRTDYPAQAVEAARSVLLELVRLLGEYQEAIVLVGGWVPELILPEGSVKHVGSIDVDLALNHRRVREAGYRSISNLLLAKGYLPGEQPFVFHRTVISMGVEVVVEVDFLAGEYAGTGKGHRTQRVQDMQPRKARGVDLAFNTPVKVILHGTLPGGGDDTAVVQVASIVPFIIMKGMAMHTRLKEKDAWDIYYCLKNFPGGLDGLIEEFKPYLGNKLVLEGLGIIAEKFASPTAVGPAHIVNFEEIEEQEARELMQRDAFERVNYLLGRLGIMV